MNEILFKRTHLPVAAERAFQWHVEAGALERLTPSWEEARVIAYVGRADQVGSRVTLSVKEGPFRRKWIAVHTACEPGRMFRDEQVSGPFSRWVHTHSFIPDGENASWLEDRVEYKLPLGWLGRIVAGNRIRRKLERLFDYRHRVTLQALSVQPRETL
jgi:hypothetical protein